MKKGIILFFDPYKGFGKIMANDGETYFVGIEHLRAQVQKGDEVEFYVQTLHQKTEAIKVRLTSRSAETT